jgi:hypothetical protein
MGRMAHLLTQGMDRGYNSANQEDLESHVTINAHLRPSRLLSTTRPGCHRHRALPPRPTARRRADRLKSGGVTLDYQFKAGETHHYKVKAFFDGHFPPFAQPGAQPIHMLAEIVYVSKVNKQTPKGVEVSYTVESADLTLLTREYQTTETIDLNDQTPFPIELTDVQQALNTTAVIRPNGTISDIVSSGPSPIKVNIGFDLRKLFLLTMPITFPQTPLSTGDSWLGAEGVLGSRPGSITYKNRLTRVTPGGKGAEYRIDQDATSTIDDQLDMKGNSTRTAKDVVSILKGTIRLGGTVTFSASPPVGGKPGMRAGRMASGQLELQVNLQRKTTKSGVPAEIVQSTDGDFDVKGRLLFSSDDAPQKSALAGPGGQKNGHVTQPGGNK